MSNPANSLGTCKYKQSFIICHIHVWQMIRVISEKRKRALILTVSIYHSLLDLYLQLGMFGFTGCYK